jgi:catechol 2,3-dioxygenase
MSGVYGIRPEGFRLPAETAPGRVRLQVADLERSVGYYEHTIGLVTAARSPGHAALAPRGGQPVIVELVERAGARPVPRRGAFGLFHFAILVPDRPSLGRFLQHALEQGAVSGVADHAVSEAVYLSDPDGLGIEVYADRPSSTWPVDREQQLSMTTEPLDISGVLASGAGRPWDGLPAGTRMGHVHLHVGDLAVAEAFYHRGLGLDKIVWTYPGALFMSAGGYHHHLGTNTWSRGGPAAADAVRLLSWDLEVPERNAIDAAVASLRMAGHAAEPDGDGWAVADPWGTVLRLRLR